MQLSVLLQYVRVSIYYKLKKKNVNRKFLRKVEDLLLALFFYITRPHKECGKAINKNVTIFWGNLHRSELFSLKFECLLLNPHGFSILYVPQLYFHLILGFSSSCTLQSLFLCFSPLFPTQVYLALITLDPFLFETINLVHNQFQAFYSFLIVSYVV